MADEELPLFVHWERTLGDLLDRTARFPKAVRFTFTSRIDNAALDIVDKIVEARYAKGSRKARLLQEIDVLLARLRILLRLCNRRRYLDNKGYESLSRSLAEAGRMIGGWRCQQSAS